MSPSSGRRTPVATLVVATLIFVVACGGPAGNEGESRPDAGSPVLGAVSPAQLADELAHKDFLLVDVHVPYAGALPGTDASISYEDEDGLVAFIGADLDRKVVLTCLGDGMSRNAGSKLVARGYRAVRFLSGGMNAWKAAGYELRR